MIKSFFLDLGRLLLPKRARLALLRATRWPPVNRVQLGHLRRVQPINRDWGETRGRPIDRHYIETFLAAHAAAIHGRVLEVGDSRYTRSFGGSRVTRSEVVHFSEDSSQADYTADFAHAPQLPTETFDCVICTQTLQVVPDLSAAVATLHRILRPGGVLLVTVPGISQIYEDLDFRWHDFWRFTAHSAGWMFRKAFPDESVSVHTYGNVLASIAFLHGLAAEELTDKELAHQDPLYPMIVAVKAQKPADSG